MMNDISAIIWKEWREFFFQQSIKSKLQTIILVAFIGVLLPVNKGSQWFDQPFFYGVAILGPVLMMVTVTGDLFAGERERHTLETLLASKLSGRGIVLGKILFAFTYAVAIITLLLLLNVVSLNIAYYNGKLLIFSLRAAAVLAAISVFAALFTSLVGVAISVGAKTVKQAQLTITIAVASLALMPSVLIGVLPDNFKTTFLRYYLSLSGEAVVLIGLFTLLIACVISLKVIFYRIKKLERCL